MLKFSLIGGDYNIFIPEIIDNKNLFWYSEEIKFVYLDCFMI